MNAAAVPFARARRELVAARHVPYTALVAPEVVRTLYCFRGPRVTIGGHRLDGRAAAVVRASTA